eukprot:GAHX01000385.1.p1 GENE.GAHX01000385.1~~GAHX01000385.1.p1  ORF type:complete len:232 (+),score=26.49 GAHX01000385.1:49-744(+)
MSRKRKASTSASGRSDSGSYSGSYSSSESHSEENYKHSGNLQRQTSAVPSSTGKSPSPIYISFLYSLPPSWGHPYPAWQGLMFIPIIIGAVVFVIGHSFQTDVLYPIFGGWRKFGYPFILVLLNLLAVFVIQRGDSKSASPLKYSICIAAIVFGICLAAETGELFANELKYYEDWCSESRGTNKLQGCQKWMTAFYYQVSGASIFVVAALGIGFIAYLNGNRLECEGFISK